MHLVSSAQAQADPLSAKETEANTRGMHNLPHALHISARKHV
jgi:hypothetical protein